MTDFQLGEKFDLVIIPFRAFQHLVAAQDQIACLERVREHLTPDGRLILDVFVTNPRRMYDPVYLTEAEDFGDVELPDGRKLRRGHRLAAFHRVEQYNDVELIHYVTHRDGRTERLVQAFPMRYFFRYELEHLFARCGLRVAEVFGDFDRSALTDDSPAMIFVVEGER